jgi:hypothetical protein
VLHTNKTAYKEQVQIMKCTHEAHCYHLLQAADSRLGLSYPVTYSRLRVVVLFK